MLKEFLLAKDPSTKILALARRDKQLNKALEAYQQIAVQSGYLEIMRRPNTVNDFLQSLVKLNEEELERVELAYENEVEEDIDKVIAVEEHRLKAFVIKLTASFATIIGLIFVLTLAYNSIVNGNDPTHNVLDDSFKIFVEIFKVFF